MAEIVTRAVDRVPIAVTYMQYLSTGKKCVCVTYMQYLSTGKKCLCTVSITVYTASV